jgi:hypothetical protein
MQPINTVFSTDSVLDIPEIVEAKEILNKEYGSKYFIPITHMGYSIVPCPKYNFEKIKEEILEYISKQKPYKIVFKELVIQPESHFVYLKTEGKDPKRIHEEITKISNKYRDDYVREKDLERLDEGKFNDLEKQYLKEYGYTRVMDLYKSHITIGSFDMDTDIEEVENKLQRILEPILNKEIVVDNIHPIFHTDSKGSQLGMQVIWEEVIKLS